LPKIGLNQHPHTPGEVANYCKKNNIPLIHFSTDYVFDGQKNDLYTEEDIPHPINIYGKTKLDGELAIIDSGCDYFVFRTSWVYSMRAGGFVNKVIQWAERNETSTIVDDQIGSPTWARMLAVLSTSFVVKYKNHLKQYIHDNSGIYHLAGGGYTSRFEWTKTIIEYFPQDQFLNNHKIIPANSSEFPYLALRPMFSGLDSDKFEKIFSLKIPDWKISLKLTLEKQSEKLI